MSQIDGSNLLLRLHKWAHRQDENFLTEVFAHLLQHLLQNESQAGVELLRQLTCDVVNMRSDEASSVAVTTQVTKKDVGRPDVEIKTPQNLLYVEVKVESEVDPDQIRNYLDDLKSKGNKEKNPLILLTRDPPSLPAGLTKDPQLRPVRWYQVATWLEGLPLTTCSPGAYLVEQLIDFLRIRNMSIDKVCPELTEGVRSLSNLLKMVRETVIKGLGHTLSPFKLSLSDGIIGSFVDDKKYWTGLGLTEPQTLAVQTYKFHVDENKVDKGHSDGLFDNDWPNEIPGKFRWRRRLNLDVGEIAFLNLPKDAQMKRLEDFYRDYFEYVVLIEASSAASSS